MAAFLFSMPDEFSASTGGPSPSPDAGATSASGSDAGSTAPAESSNPGAIAPEPAAPGLDAGWSFEDQAPKPSLPDNDDDIQGMLADPALDPQRTPGVVEALRNARAEARARNQEVSQLRQQMAQLEQYGGVEGLTQMAALNVGQLMADPQNGALPFLSSLWNSSQPAYAELLGQLVKAEPAYLVAALQEAGHLPEAPQARVGSI